MKKLLRNVLILISPFLLMALINEAVRSKINETPYTYHGISAINSAEYLPKKCTWICHDQTPYCKENHVKYLKPFYAITDVLYFGVICILESTGNYSVANIIFLVFLFPLTILYFTFKSIDMQIVIQKLKKKEHE